MQTCECDTGSDSLLLCHLPPAHAAEPPPAPARGRAASLLEKLWGTELGTHHAAAGSLRAQGSDLWVGLGTGTCSGAICPAPPPAPRKISSKLPSARRLRRSSGLAPWELVERVAKGEAQQTSDSPGQEGTGSALQPVARTRSREESGMGVKKVHAGVCVAGVGLCVCEEHQANNLAASRSARPARPLPAHTPRQIAGLLGAVLWTQPRAPPPASRAPLRAAFLLLSLGAGSSGGCGEGGLWLVAQRPALLGDWKPGWDSGAMGCKTARSPIKVRERAQLARLPAAPRIAGCGQAGESAQLAGIHVAVLRAGGTPPHPFHHRHAVS